ncbi:MAG: carbohydrate ABC transporter permease [Planctomycetota bacterium]
MRLLVVALYLLVLGGAVTMVYPFLITVSGSFKTNVDKNDFDAFPAFFNDDTVLWRKHMECKYHNRLSDYNTCNREKAYEFRTLEQPKDVHASRVADWKEFESTRPPTPSTYNLGYMTHAGDSLRPWKQREFRAHLTRLCNGDIQEYNRRFNAQEEKWLGVGAVEERLTERRFQKGDDAFTNEFYAFKTSQPVWFRSYPSIDGIYVQNYLSAIYGLDIQKYNERMGTAWTSFRDYVMSRRLPDNEPERNDWEHFVREELNLQLIGVDPEARPLFAKLLSERYAGDLSLLNQRYGTSYASFDDVPYPQDTITVSLPLVDWAEFVKTVPVEYLFLKTTETDFRDFLKDKYKDDLAALIAAHQVQYASFDVVPMPSLEVQYEDFLENRKALRHEFATANYKQVFDYILLHGRSLINTVIYCGLAILTALIVNPLAAYALSRYKIPSTYKILLFCMATMAFPPAVTMIPNFLLLRDLGLLNTFSALVLPGMASGFMIFLLKGFFDSLPREMYESAQIDGASEWVMFWQFTMALSKPILAVLALGAFTSAYGNFMFAFILCPKEKMWTLMVFLYQFQQSGGMGLTFAALLVAAIPTFIVFVFCQNIIIRGIVVPVEK